MSEQPRVRAAQYLRMSTHGQRHSIEQQATANAAYAQERGYDIVRTYVDAGLSGLTLDRREALQQLLADVMARTANYQVILVYDVSRWGRFQDPDEGAHYEFVCREAGVAVEYAAEPFENDGSLTATLVKHLKRAMAAEYSRELSARIIRAKGALAAGGFCLGGPASYGYRRRVVQSDGSLGQVLERGERGALRGRALLVKGPLEEVAVVRWIFRAYGIEDRSTREIAASLNAVGQADARRRGWTQESVRGVLRDEKCVGVLVSGRRRSIRFGGASTTPADAWRSIPAPHLAIVSRRLFETCRAKMPVRRRSISDAALLEALRAALARHGRLSDRILHADADLHCPAVYIGRFGGLLAAYAQVGYQPDAKQLAAADRIRRSRPHLARTFEDPMAPEIMLARLRSLLAAAGRLSAPLIDAAPDMPAASSYRRTFGSLRQAYELAGYTPHPTQQRHFDRLARR